MQEAATTRQPQGAVPNKRGDEETKQGGTSQNIPRHKKKRKKNKGGGSTIGPGIVGPMDGGGFLELGEGKSQRKTPSDHLH